MAGKGDKRRPSAVDEDTLAERWEVTFGQRPRCGAETVRRIVCNRGQCHPGPHRAPDGTEWWDNNPEVISCL